MSTRRARWSRRLATISVLFATVVATAIATEPAAHAANAPTFLPGTVVGEAPDFALSHWADAWDFSNSSDMLLDKGPSSGIIGARYTGGVLAYTITGHSYATPLWGGYPGSLYLGRDGMLRGNQIDINYYTRFHLHAYVSRKTFGVLLYFTCSPPKASCQGGPSFTLAPGWNDIDLPVRSPSRPTASNWAQNLRVTLMASAPTAVQLDFLRVYHPASQVTWASPERGTGAQLFWSDGVEYPTSRSRHGGPVVSASATTVSGQAWTPTDVSGYPAGTRFYAVSSNGVMTPASEALAILPIPSPIIDSPSQAGCGDYATSVLGHPWRFTSPRSLAGYGNMARLTFTGGVLSATNAGPHRNDPYFYLPLGRNGIDGRRWHRLTIVESYDGRFDLRDAPGGGTMARVLWGAAGRITLSQTNDILTYSGKRSIWLDLAWPTSRLVEPDGTAAQRYAFASSRYRITRLRIDPNEDPGARRWHIYSVRLAENCATRTYFNVTWRDTQFTWGNQATVVARDVRGRIFTIATVAERPGTNSVPVYARQLPTGHYTMLVLVNNAGGSARTTATGPLTIAH